MWGSKEMTGRSKILYAGFGIKELSAGRGWGRLWLSGESVAREVESWLARVGKGARRLDGDLPGKSKS